MRVGGIHTQQIINVILERPTMIRVRNRGLLAAVLIFSSTSLWAADFVDVTNRSPLLVKGRPGAFADYDNDGWTDLMIKRQTNDYVLLHNEGDFRFVDSRRRLPAFVTDGIGGDNQIGIFADYDNDGDQDLFAPGNSFAGLPDALLQNDHGIFVDVLETSGLTEAIPYFGLAATWLDFDSDGYVDLYASRADPTAASSTLSQLHRNLGDGSFVDATQSSGLPANILPYTGHATVALYAGDLTSDGRPDLVIGSWILPPAKLFVQNEDGTFQDQTVGSGFATDGWLAGIAAGDIDGDGDIDLFHATSDRADSATSQAGLVSQSLLLLNLGDGQFLDVTASAGLTNLGRENSGPWFSDGDGDGDLDLFLDSPRLLFSNHGDGSFEAEPFNGVSWSEGKAGRSLAAADLDRDGDEDYWFGGTEEQVDTETEEVAQIQTDASLLQNDTSGANWLAVELVGTRSNRDGIGARAIVVTGGNRQRREVIGGTGFDQSDRVVVFGLGSASFADHLEIRWPSGIVDEIDAVPAGGRVRVIEGSGVAHRAPPTTWVSAPPLAIDAGQTLAWDLGVRPSLFDSLSTVIRVAADLSDLGGPAEALFNPDGDGNFRWQGNFKVIGAGPTSLDVLIEQETSLGPYWTRLSRTIEVTMAPTAVLETQLSTMPGESALGANYPNPFNSGTVIPFALETAGQAELHIFDLLGQRVATLISGFREAGTYQLHWDATDDAHRPLASGTYFYRLLTEHAVESRKLILLR
ncbi:MAG: T9SS type A sorting domain-containing protein [Chloroflexi bacterium]|nr:T9SS type A sorting domain-containing protein [Chloroflexota bacterium]